MDITTEIVSKHVFVFRHRNSLSANGIFLLDGKMQDLEKFYSTYKELNGISKEIEDFTEDEVREFVNYLWSLSEFIPIRDVTLIEFGGHQSFLVSVGWTHEDYFRLLKDKKQSS